MEDKHNCIHENWWGELKSDVKSIKSDLKDIRWKLNGKDGAITQGQLNRVSISRLWWFVGGVIFLFLATGVKAWFF